MASLLYLSLLWFHLMVVSSSSSSSLQQQPPLFHDGERSALLQFKQTLFIRKFASGYPSAYPKTEKWECAQGSEESCDCCSWDGIECDTETGHVIGLHLASSCLYGFINSTSTLFRLVHLRRLDLSDNHFNYSEIPSGIGQLWRLRSLNLSWSIFSGQIPSQLLALSKLAFLDLSRNEDLHLQKPGLRNMAESLTHLEKLHLSEVNISSTIPESLSNLSSLTSLLLRECGLHGEFPMSIFRLPRLQFLDISYNGGVTSFSGELPSSTGKLGSLIRLDISSCNFRELVAASHGQLTQLSHLDISDNSFSGQIPSFLGTLTQLSYLDISDNSFSGQIPSFLGTLTQLSYLDISYNSFSGQIPSFLANLTQLTFLSLTANQFSVANLAWLGQQAKLTALQLRQINLTGTIPSSLVNMSKLTTLDLGENHLIDQIPSWLSNITQLTSLLLDGNNLQGPIPSSLFELVNLEYLYLSSNQLDGTVELSMLFNPKKFRALILSGNNLTVVGNMSINATLPRFSYLGLGSCKLSEFPGFLKDQDGLSILSLRNNSMLGQIPKFICSMRNLRVLDLSYNNLSGRIPPCLTNFSTSLGILNLESNNLHGTIPQRYSASSNLQVINFSQNQLEGKIPRSLANCAGLKILNLGNNLINDTFPHWMGCLQELRVLILRFNKFHGVIGNPETNAEFSKLHIIDLSCNNFIGNLPSEYFKKWNAMKTLDADRLEYILEESSVFQDDGNIKMMIKGFIREYEKIPKELINVDLSSNKFDGEIPYSIGNLTWLWSLNLSHNALIGHIPSSFGNLTKLETLDLSENKLSGEIPQQLTRLTFLQFFDVSHNHLTGHIPQGNQFNTFPNTSFDGNPGLCGIPLSRAYESSKGLSSPPPSTSEDGSLRKFDLKFVLMGYGSGLVIGVSIGHVLTTWKHEWFVETFGRRQTKRRTKKRTGNRT